MPKDREKKRPIVEAQRWFLTIFAKRKITAFGPYRRVPPVGTTRRQNWQNDWASKMECNESLVSYGLRKPITWPRRERLHSGHKSARRQFGYMRDGAIHWLYDPVSRRDRAFISIDGKASCWRVLCPADGEQDGSTHECYYCHQKDHNYHVSALWRLWRLCCHIRQLLLPPIRCLGNIWDWNNQRLPGQARHVT
jgi:hypothetical protein